MYAKLATSSPIRVVSRPASNRHVIIDHSSLSRRFRLSSESSGRELRRSRATIMTETTCDHDADARIAHLKRDFEAAQATLRQMEHLPDLVAILGDTDTMKNMNGGTTDAECRVGVEKATETSQAVQPEETKRRDGTPKRNSTLTSEKETEDRTTFLVSDRKYTDSAQDSKKGSPSLSTGSPDLNTEVLPTGRSRYFTRKRYPVTTTFRVDASSDSDSADESKTVSRVRKRKQKQVGVGDKTDAKKRKPESNSPTNAPSTKKGVKCQATTEHKTPTKTVASTGDKEKNVVSSCPPSAVTTSSWPSQFSSGGNGTALYQHLFNGSSYFSVAAPGTSVTSAPTPRLFYGPTMIGENGMPYNYFWTTPSWNAQYPSTPMLMNSALNGYYSAGRALYRLAAPTKGVANNSKGQWQMQSTMKQDCLPHAGLPGLSTSPLKPSTPEKKSKTIML